MNPRMLIKYSAQLKEQKFFRYPPAQDLFVLYQTVADRYKQVPTETEMGSLLGEIARKKGYSVVEMANIYADLREVYDGTATEITGENVKLTIVRRITQDTYGKLLTTEPSDLKEVMREFKGHLNAVTRDVAEDDHWGPGFSMFSESGVRSAIRWVNELYTSGVVPLGWPRLDKHMGGGLRGGELLLFMTSTGLGKTLAAINLVSNLAVAGKRALYYFTDNTRAEMAERVSACITRRAIRYEVREEHEYTQSILHAVGGYNDNLILMELPPGRFSIPDVREHISINRETWANWDRMRGVPEENCGEIDVIVLDYLEEFKSGEGKGSDWEEVRQSSVACKGIAKELSLPVVALTQGNKESLSAEIHEMWMGGSSTQKFNPAAHVIIQNKQNSVERASNKVLWFIPKSRRINSRYVSPMLLDKARQLILEDPDQDIYAMEELGEKRMKAPKLSKGRGSDVALPADNIRENKGTWKREYGRKGRAKNKLGEEIA